MSKKNKRKKNKLSKEGWIGIIAIIVAICLTVWMKWDDIASIFWDNSGQ